MDYPTLLLALSFDWTCIQFLIKHRATQSLAPVTLPPPGPRPFPIIGNILELGNKPHGALATLSKTYGPIMTIKLGSITTKAFSSPETAKEVLHKHDQAFSRRRIPDSVQVLNDHKVSMAWLPVSSPWRNLRKVCTIQMFSTRQLDATQSMRRKKVQELLDYVHKHCNSGSALDIGQAACTAVLNSISSTLFSIDLAHHHSHLSQSFKELAWRVMEEVGKPNIADYFPVLRFVDPQGSRRRITRYFERIFTFFDGIVKERLRVRVSSPKFKENNDVLDALLCIVDEKNSKFSLTDIKHLLQDLFFAGIDTTSGTVEWAMAELLRTPQKLAQAQMEVRELLGKDGIDRVEEFEIAKFPYLQAIVKETFRLHPPGPFRIPHRTETELDVVSQKEELNPGWNPSPEHTRAQCIPEPRVFLSAGCSAE